MTPIARRVGLLVALVAALSRSAAAHPEHASGNPTVPVIPVATILLGVAILAGSLYGDRSGAIDRWLGDVGLVVGILVALTGIAWLWI